MPPARSGEVNILDWIRAKRPGLEDRVADELRIHHANGSTSSLWLREAHIHVPAALAGIEQVYGEFDGADLFSSTFKIGSIEASKSRGGVRIVPSLADLAVEAETLGCRFPQSSTVFMVQAGIGLYAAPSAQAGVFEWDVVEEAVTDVFANVLDVLDQWLAAVEAEV